MQILLPSLTGNTGTECTKITHSHSLAIFSACVISQCAPTSWWIFLWSPFSQETKHEKSWIISGNVRSKIQSKIRWLSFYTLADLTDRETAETCAILLRSAQEASRERKEIFVPAHFAEARLWILSVLGILREFLGTPKSARTKFGEILNLEQFREKILVQKLGCRKWGCNKWGLKGCLAALPGNRPWSAFFALFLPFSPFSGGCEEHLGNPENGGKKGIFPQISSDLLKPPSLNPHLRHSKKNIISVPNSFGEHAALRNLYGAKPVYYLQPTLRLPRL